MSELDTEDINEMYKWQKGIKRVLETDPRFVQDESKRWSLRSVSDFSKTQNFCDDFGYHSRNTSLQSDDELHTFKKVSSRFIR